MKYKDIPVLRKQLWKEQDYNCKLCGQPISEDELALDHSHNSGHIRGTLHKGCNAWLGHLENNMTRNKIDKTKLVNIVNNLICYLETERDEVHPIHLKKKRKPKK